MKKFLSLVLALVMTMSLVTVSAGAKDFGDSADLSGEAYEEAVNVMSEMGIIDGYAGGNFQPQGTLTRGAAAKIIACMMLGKTTAEALGTSAAPFKDVPAGSTFAGYIAYCVESGLIDGYADGTFRPQGTLTGFAFLKMLLTALGYDSSIEGYTGANWTVNVMGRAQQIGLTTGDDEFVGSRAITREEAALFAVNALKSTLVEYASKGTNVTVNGATVAIGASKATYVTSSIAGAATSIDNTRDNYTGDYTVEFAERYQPDLELDADIDAFGRPAHTWSWDGEEIGTYVDRDLLRVTYTAKVEGGDIYNDLSATACDYDLTYWVDGKDMGRAYADGVSAILERRNDDTVGTTGNGVLTEVFVDTDAKELTIVEIHTYLAEVTGDYSERNENLRLGVYTANNTPRTYTAELDNVSNLADFEDEDWVLVTIADNEIMSVEDAEILTDQSATRYTSSSGKMTSITAGGTKYDVAYEAHTDADILENYSLEQLYEYRYDLYMDAYGYVIGIAETESASNYAFIVGYENGSSVLASSVDKALMIFPDGTMKVVDAQDKDTEYYDTVSNSWKTVGAGYFGTLGGHATGDNPAVHKWVTYTVDNGVYEIDRVVRNQSQAGMTVVDDQHNSINTGVANRWAFGNDDSVFVAVEADQSVNTGYSIVDVNSVSTGIKGTNIDADSTTGWANFNGANTFFAWDDDYYITYAVVVGENTGSKEFVYITDGPVERSIIEDGTYYDRYEGIVNGEWTDQIMVDSAETNTTRTKLTADTLYEVGYDQDGNIVSKDAIANANANLNPSLSESAGYAMALNPTLRLVGSTMWIDNLTTGTGYIMVGEAGFYVENEDGDYDYYGTARAALNAAEDEGYTITKVTAICNSDNGYAETVILSTSYRPTSGGGVGGMSLSNVRIGNTNVGAATGYANIADAVANARPVYLSSAQLTYGLSDYTATSTIAATNAIQAVYKVFADASSVSTFDDSNDDTTAAAVTTGKTVTVNETSGNVVALGNGNVIVIRVNDDTVAGQNTGNLTWFAYVISEEI